MLQIELKHFKVKWELILLLYKVLYIDGIGHNIDTNFKELFFSDVSRIIYRETLNEFWFFEFNFPLDTSGVFPILAHRTPQKWPPFMVYLT